MPALLQEPVTADVITAELELDVDRLLQADPPPAEEPAGTRFDFLELQEKGFDKSAIQLMALAGLVNDEEAVEKRQAPGWIDPQTLQDVEMVLRIVESREKALADLETQHTRKKKRLAGSLK